MSNPGVLTLMEKNISPKRSFRVEDNLGEAIHFHYNDIRIDLTIQELLYIASVNDEAVYDLIEADNLDLDEYNPFFLNEISQYMIDLVHVEKKQIRIGDALVYYKGKNNFPHIKRIRKYKKTKKEFVTYRNNQDFAPVIFNGVPTIMNAAYLDVQKVLGEKTDSDYIDVIDWQFEKGKHTVSNTPWKEYFFKWDKKRILSVAKHIASKLM